MAQTKGKYWLAGHSDTEITYDEVKELATISETDFGVVSDLTNSAANINAARDAFTASTALSAATTLTVNTLYHVTDTDTAIYAMPASATKGDVIKVVYSVDVANAGIHDYGTASAFWAASSNVFKKAGVEIWAFVTKPNGSSNDFLKLTGAANAGVGIGSWLTFTYNGTLWHAEGKIYAKGAGSSAVTAAFADTTG